MLSKQLNKLVNHKTYYCYRPQVRTDLATEERSVKQRSPTETFCFWGRFRWWGILLLRTTIYCIIIVIVVVVAIIVIIIILQTSVGESLRKEALKKRTMKQVLEDK